MKKTLSKIFIFIIIVVLITVYFTQIINVNNNHNQAISGVIDLNNDYIECNGFVPISGEWNFYPNIYIDPSELAKTDALKVGVKLPGLWKDNNGVQGKKGYGTYTLTLDNVKRNTIVSFLFPIGPSEAYDVYIDNNKVFSAGQISKFKDQVIPQYKSNFVDAVINDGTVITLHVSNLSLHKGGFVRPITVGLKKEMLKLKRNILIKDIFVLAFLCLLLLVIIIMIIITNRNRVLLIYFLIADLMSICYVMSTGETFINNFFPNLPFMVYYTMYFMPSMFGGTLLILVIHNIYNELSCKIVGVISLIKVAVLYIVFFFMKHYFLGVLSNIKDIIVLLEFVYCIVILVKAITLKRKNTVLILTGVIILLCSILWDIMYAYGVISTPLELLEPYGLLIFMLCFIVATIKEYQSAYTLLEKYNINLANYTEDMGSKENHNDLELPQIINSNNTEIDNKKLLMIYVMDNFEVVKQDGSLVHFKTKKAKELMAYLVHYKNKELTSDSIINELWPDKPYDKARGLFYTSFYFLRKEFNTPENTIFSKRYVLEDKYFFSDYDIVQDMIKKLDSYENGKIDNSNIKFFEKLITMYKNGYMGKIGYSWANQMRIFIDNKVMLYSNNALEFYRSKNKTNNEIALCEKMIQIDEFQESYYKRLMYLYNKINNKIRYEEIKLKYENAMKELE